MNLMAVGLIKILTPGYLQKADSRARQHELNAAALLRTAPIVWNRCHIGN